MTQQSTYTGHGARTGGLQGHSIGETYPYIPYAQATVLGTCWGVLHADGECDTGPVFFTSEAAHRHAAVLKATAEARAERVAAFLLGRQFALGVARCRSLQVTA